MRRSECWANERKAYLAAMGVPGQNQADRRRCCREYVGAVAQEDRNAAKPSHALRDSADVGMQPPAMIVKSQRIGF